MGDAQALRGDEGRDKLRKATGIGTYELIRRYPNGKTQHVEDMLSLFTGRRTRGTETSKYPEEEKTISDSVSSGERTRISPNQYSYGYIGVVGLQCNTIMEHERSGKVYHSG